MSRTLAISIAVAACLALPQGAAAKFEPGAPGIGDPYFPLDGNGGYDVQRYALDLSYDPSSDMLAGTATIRARATQDLSRFNLDLIGMNVRGIKVNGRTAKSSREGGELIVTPSRGLTRRKLFTAVVAYDGVPQTIEEDALGTSGFRHTDDGSLVAGQPHGAATWFPVNDHPLDTAAFTFRVTVPEGLAVVANGDLTSSRTHGDRTTWVWEAREPMAPYLATSTIGRFDLRAYREDGISYVDAVDPDLLVAVVPRTGRQFAISQAANSSYKRLGRTVSVPAAGGQLSFWVRRDTEPNWDFLFVEAHPVGSDSWTTLPDVNGHTSPDTGRSCPFWLALHPFLAHYQSDKGDGSCSPSGSSGTWSAADGASDGYEQWAVDLGAYAGGDVEVSISYASDDTVQGTGVLVDDITVPGGAGSTSFEADGDTMDGWVVSGAPAGSEPNTNDWIAGTVDDQPPPAGVTAKRSLSREPEMIAFLADLYGPYPFSAAGGIVDDLSGLGFALETQTRPIYAREFLGDPIDGGESIVLHELAHQWVGDSLALARWRDIWLNEGFATYAEWLWSEHIGADKAQEIFDGMAGVPADDELWSLPIGDPGPQHLFDFPVYVRGAMTLHAVRMAVGDHDFFRILRTWAQSRAGENVTTEQFSALAERVSGKKLDDLFDTWLFTATKPPGIEPPPAAAARRQTIARRHRAAFKEHRR